MKDRLYDQAIWRPLTGPLFSPIGTEFDVSSFGEVNKDLYSLLCVIST